MLDAAARQAPAEDHPATPLQPAAATQCWQLHRPCALTPRQFLFSYALLLAASGLVALLASLQGWWIVAVCCALEMLAAGAMYLVYMVHAVDGERITLAPDGLLRVDLAHGLRQRHVVMNPAWTRLERCRSRGQHETLWLCSRQTRIEVASQCGPLQKQRLERELRQALAACQQGRTGRTASCAPSAHPAGPARSAFHGPAPHPADAWMDGHHPPSRLDGGNCVQQQQGRTRADLHAESGGMP